MGNFGCAKRVAVVKMVLEARAFARALRARRDLLGKGTMQTHFDAEFDIVVVGGGSAGCIVASRLTENAAVSVCLIEAGRRDRHFWIHIPLGFGKLVPDPKVNWDGCDSQMM